MIWVKMAAILVAAVSMLLAAMRHREWRGGLLLIGCVFLSAAMNEPEAFFRNVFPIREPELPAIIFFLVLGVVLAALNRGTTLLALKAVYDNRRFPLLVWGLCLVSFLPQLGTDKHIWAAVFPPSCSTHETRELVEHGIEFLGYLFLLNWAILFLKDKWKILVCRVPSPHEHLLQENELVEVGHGSRRTCYRIGDTGFCVKFYRPPEECVAGKMKKSIRRDIGWRRFNKSRNSSSQEVHVYNTLRHRMPESVRECLPPVCERVFHPKYGWGVLETYYTNPDGTAIISYELEIKRQESAAVISEIYRQAKNLLRVLISCSAPFYEPGNVHTLFRRDGAIEMKIVDFEPESKMLIPLEAIWPWYRRRKLARKAERCLARIRARHGICDCGEGCEG